MVTELNFVGIIDNYDDGGSSGGGGGGEAARRGKKVGGRWRVRSGCRETYQTL